MKMQLTSLSLLAMFGFGLHAQPSSHEIANSGSPDYQEESYFRPPSFRPYWPAAPFRAMPEPRYGYPRGMPPLPYPPIDADVRMPPPAEFDIVPPPRMAPPPPVEWYLGQPGLAAPQPEIPTSELPSEQIVNQSDVIANLSRQIDELQRRIESLQAENDRLSAIGPEKTETQPASQSHLAERSLLEASMAALSAERDQLHLQLNALMTEKEQLASQRQELEQRLQTLEQRAADMPPPEDHQAALNELRLERDSLDSKLKALQQSYGALEQQVSQAPPAGTPEKDTAEIARLKQSLADSEDAVGGLKMRLNNSESTIAGLKAAYQDARKKLDQLSAIQQPLQNELDQTKSQLNEQAQLVQQSTAEIEQLKQLITNLQAQNAGLSGQLDTLKKSGQSSNDQQAQLQEELSRLRSESETCETALQTANETVSAFERQLQQFSALKNEYDLCLSEKASTMEALSRLQSTQQSAAQIEPMPSTAMPATQSDLVDSDQDGVVDSSDLCPATPAAEKVDAMGCHQVEPIRLEGVNFESGSANFTPESLNVLNGVAGVLGRFPDLNLEIAGHTDNTGSRDLNIELSSIRATAVRNYLIEKGIPGERLTAVGYGPDQPVAGNGTPDGRAMNRRVELRRR
jgi:outer membrane protein OmpA-like peptidoglycan-associated protein